MNLFRRALWLYGFLAVLAGPLLAADLTGRVTAVSDGDSITLLVPDGASYKQVKVRLGEIDTPESNGQPYGERAKQALSDLAFGEPAREGWCRLQVRQLPPPAAVLLAGENDTAGR